MRHLSRILTYKIAIQIQLILAPPFERSTGRFDEDVAEVGASLDHLGPLAHVFNNLIIAPITSNGVLYQQV
jgi:hypothetical protein